MSKIRRYSNTLNGAITFTGNSLGYLKTGFYISAFITADLSQQVSGYPAGSTLDWQKNQSAAQLRIPNQSDVVYAELIWCGGTGAGIDPAVPITFITPVQSKLISPDPNTAFNGGYYARSANVTSLVRKGGAGTYQVSGVPSTNNSAVGWTLAVVYKNATLPSRNISFFVSSASISNGNPQNIVLSGFGTPTTGSVQARVLVTAVQGDPNLTGDQLQFGPDSSSLQALSGPNNPVDNFFISQVNDDNGNLDTSGTAGNLNPVIGTSNYPGGVRYGWDITNVDASATMRNAQNQAIARMTSNGDGYVVAGMGIQIDVDSPKIEINKTVNKTEVKVGEVLTYIALLTNTSHIDAQNAIFKDILPKELKFVPGSVRVDGIPQPTANPTRGVTIGTVGTEEVFEVTFRAKVVNLPPDELVKNQAALHYEFESAPGLPIAKGEAVSNQTETKVIVRPPTNCEKNQSTIEFSIQEEEKAIQALLDAEAGKTRVANQALANGSITNHEHSVIVQSANGVSQALSTLKQELQNKRNTIQDLCNGCK